MTINLTKYLKIFLKTHGVIFAMMFSFCFSGFSQSSACASWLGSSRINVVNIGNVSEFTSISGNSVAKNSNHFDGLIFVGCNKTHIISIDICAFVVASFGDFGSGVFVN